MIYLYLIGWFAIGVASYIFWWTRSFDFTTKEINSALYCGIMGPSAFLLGALIHGEDLFDGKVLIKGKRRKP